MNAKKTGREEILSRIREALQDVPAAEEPIQVVVTRNYLRNDTAARPAIIERFIERVADYKVMVQHIEQAELAETIVARCMAREVRRLVVPSDLSRDWVPQNVECLRDLPSLSNEQLDTSDGVLTGCALGIASTGTIVLDGGPSQGRRVLTLLPDYHLCVIFEHQIVDLVPEAMTRLADTVLQRRRPLTFISGPSATSDIELNRVEGVHGPRTLEVLVVRA